jgi:hypothetical protein
VADDRDAGPIGQVWPRYEALGRRCLLGAIVAGVALGCRAGDRQVVEVVV